MAKGEDGAGLGRAGKVTLATVMVLGNVVVVVLAAVRFAEGDVVVGLGWLVVGAGAVTFAAIVLATVVETVVSRGRGG